MADCPVGFQVALELSKILPIRRVLAGAAEQLLHLARSLRRSGSDLLVEEDLISYFGRVRINPELSTRFKQDILQKTEIISLPTIGSIGLSRGAGPTLNRAIAEKGSEENLACVIQLSLLGAMHERVSLASIISYAMDQRLRLSLGTTLPRPDYNGILNTLAVCSSQSSAFLWSAYTEKVREMVESLFPFHAVHDGMNAIPGNALVIYVDGLGTIQRWPEEYCMLVQGRAGCITLVAWAHFLLGLSVCVRYNAYNKQVSFPSQASSAHVIIEVNEESLERLEVCLLDRQKNIALRMDPSAAEFVPSRAQERLPLRNYCTTTICRYYDESPSWVKSQVFKDCRNFTIAIALAQSTRLERSNNSGGSIMYSIKKWQIWNAARILFDDEKLEYEVIENLANMVLLEDSVESFPREKLPLKLNDYLKCKPDNGMKTIFGLVAADIVAIATVSQVDDCAELPLIAHNDLQFPSEFANALIRQKNHIPVFPNTIFGHLCLKLVGPDLHQPYKSKDNDENSICAVSDFGWTIIIPTWGAGDSDPSQINLDKIYVKPGVPTDMKTGERKFQVRDATVASRLLQGHSGDKTTWILDSSDTSTKQRCVSRVLQRDEFYGVQEDFFSVMIRFKGAHDDPAKVDGRKTPFQIYRSYADLYWSFWHVFRAPSCVHSASTGSRLASGQLNVDITTAIGTWSWIDKENDDSQGLHGEEIFVAERIIIVLVGGDARARWLAVSASKGGIRQTMLRGSDCCEDCAVRAAASHEGKWFVVI